MLVYYIGAARLIIAVVISGSPGKMLEAILPIIALISSIHNTVLIAASVSVEKLVWRSLEAGVRPRNPGRILLYETFGAATYFHLVSKCLQI